MKVKTWVEFEKEVEVEVSIAEVMSSIGDLDGSDQLHMHIDCINRAYRVLREVPDAKIAEMNDKQREVIGNALKDQAARYAIAAPVDSADARSHKRKDGKS